MTVTFSEIKTMLNDRPPIIWAYEARFQNIIDDLASQGIVYTAAEKNLLSHLARLQNKAWPGVAHPRVVLYASAYGNRKDETIATVRKLSTGDSAITRLCGLVNADLRVYELDVEMPVSGSLSEEEAAHAISYGLMAIDEHVDCLIVSSISEGVEKAITAMATDKQGDGLTILARHGGYDLCAMAGALLAARMAKIPVFCATPAEEFFKTLLAILTDEKESIVLSTQENAWPDVLSALRELNQLRALLTAGPQHKPAAKSGAQLLLPPTSGAARVET